MKNKEKRSVSYEQIAKELFENYESIYDVDLTTSAYRTRHQSEFYQSLNLADHGDDFFADLPMGIMRSIAPGDQAYVSRMMQKETLVERIKKDKYYSIIYRIESEGRQIYHQLRATLQLVGGQQHILIGVRNIDASIRQEMAHREEMESMRQKESNHLDAVLASAAAYMEANLSKDLILEKSEDKRSSESLLLHVIPGADAISHYSEMHSWITSNIIAENRERYEHIGNREFLLHCFSRGDRRASVSFSIYTKDGEIQPCKEVFYLYREDATGEVHVFCVIYDLTEEQKKEKELEELEEALRMSRIRNFTSQMQPHFLYNALGSIQEVILSDPEYASELLGDFTVHLRSCIRAMASDEPLPFSQELDNIRAYVNIEKMRFGEKLRVRYETEAVDFSILPLCIQPLVENAIRHGIYERGMAGGEVVIRSFAEERSWVVQVTDTGVGFDVERFNEELRRGKRDSTGLKNIMFRLEKVMNAAVEIRSRIGAGTTVIVRLPRETTDKASRKEVIA